MLWCYVENLESYDRNTKQALLIKIFVNYSLQKAKPKWQFRFLYYLFPCTFKLRPKESILLDLQFKLEIPKHIDWSNGLLTSNSEKLTIENSEEISKGIDDFIVSDILHRDFNNTFSIKKYQELGYIFLSN